jgi:hypothetical protein
MVSSSYSINKVRATSFTSVAVITDQRLTFILMIEVHKIVKNARL